MERYAFHSLVIVQSLVEGRKGGETGLRSVTAFVGDDFTQVQKEDWWPRDLINAGAQPVADSDYRMPKYRDNDQAGTPFMAWTLEYNDGFRVTHFQQRENPHGRFPTAVPRKVKNRIEPIIPLLGTFESGVPYFGCLANVI